MDEQQTSAGVASGIASLEQIASRFEAGLRARLEASGNLSEDFQRLQDSFAAAGTSTGLLLFWIVVVCAVSGGVFFSTGRLIAARAKPGGGWRRLLIAAAAALLALTAGFVAAGLVAAPGLPTRTLRLWAVLTIVACLAVVAVRALLAASRPPAPYRSPRFSRMTTDFSAAIALAVTGVGMIATVELWQGGAGLGNVTRTVVAIPVFLLFAAVVWRNRRALTAVLAGPRPRSRFRSRLAAVWPGSIIVFLVLTLLSTQAALTFGAPLPGMAVLLTVLAFVAAPHLDAIIDRKARRGMQSGQSSIAATAARQTARFAVLAALVAIVGTLWATPLAAGLGFDLTTIVRRLLEIALIVLAAAFFWNVVGAVSARAAHLEAQGGHGDGEHELGVPRSRLATLLPLLVGTAKAAILGLAILSVLASLGVNVWPLVAGLSVFGLAIGFGSQALVKDIVSGLFFLVDDAFRMGEYIESSGAKGTVEKISVRSVSLRHPRGALATIPYGDIGKIQNFSRDWAIEKLVFRVALETDVDVVKKLFKQIGQQLAADPELSPDLIETFKSQGIAEVEDGTLLIRGKFKAKAGRQFMIRRAALSAVHKAFRANGIQAVPKPITATPEVPAS